jgi:hypothetical protein
MKKEAGNLVDLNSKKADQNGVQDDRASGSPCSEKSMDKEAQEMVAALELRIKEEPEDEEDEEEEEEEGDRIEGENDIRDSGLHMNGKSYKFKSGEALPSVACDILLHHSSLTKNHFTHILVTYNWWFQEWVLVIN